MQRENRIFLTHLSSIANCERKMTIEEALSGPIRGHPIEFFSFPQNGLPALLEKESAQLSLDATIEMVFRQQVS
jgi:hypothetical protein